MRLFSNFRIKYGRLLDNLSLTQFEKDVLGARYLSIMDRTINNYRYNHFMFVILTNIVAIAGILITSLLSLEKMASISPTISNVLFWISWSLALILTLANKWLYTFDIYKKYILNKIVLEKLKSEGWQFLSGIGRYKTCGQGDRFELFCARVEHIQLKSIENMPEMEMNDAAAAILATGSAGTGESNSAKSRSPRRSKCARQAIAKDIVVDILRFVNPIITTGGSINDIDSIEDNIATTDPNTVHNTELSRSGEPKTD